MRLTPRLARDRGPAAWPAAWAVAAVTGAMLMVFALDRLTGAAPVQHLYYLPIILAGVRFTTRGGVAAGVSAIVLYHLANSRLLAARYGESDLVQVALFLSVGLIAARLAVNARQLHHLAMTDDLTGLHNLRSFEARLAAMVRAARERQQPLALLVLDMDRLKSINDRYGHLSGAEAVRAVGRIIAGRTPPDAVACRYGGDEFVIAVPDGARCAERLADDLCRSVRECAPLLAERRFAAGTLSISVGLARATFERDAWPAEGSGRDRDDGQALFGAADAALYLAKSRGRDQVIVASVTPSRAIPPQPNDPSARSLAPVRESIVAPALPCSQASVCCSETRGS
jgi:diguanylate cyclase (GGDEF)-like protein